MKFSRYILFLVSLAVTVPMAQVAQATAISGLSQKAQVFFRGKGFTSGQAINDTNNNGMTPLQVAASNSTNDDQLTTINELIKLGADVTATVQGESVSHGKTALKLVKAGNPKIVVALKEATKKAAAGKAKEQAETDAQAKPDTEAAQAKRDAEETADKEAAEKAKRDAADKADKEAAQAKRDKEAAAKEAARKEREADAREKAADARDKEAAEKRDREQLIQQADREAKELKAKTEAEQTKQEEVHQQKLEAKRAAIAAAKAKKEAAETKSEAKEAAPEENKPAETTQKPRSLPAKKSTTNTIEITEPLMMEHFFTGPADKPEFNFRQGMLLLDRQINDLRDEVLEEAKEDIAKHDYEAAQLKAQEARKTRRMAALTVAYLLDPEQHQLSEGAKKKSDPTQLKLFTLDQKQRNALKRDPNNQKPLEDFSNTLIEVKTAIKEVEAGFKGKLSTAEDIDDKLIEKFQTETKVDRTGPAETVTQPLLMDDFFVKGKGPLDIRRGLIGLERQVANLEDGLLAEANEALEEKNYEDAKVKTTEARGERKMAAITIGYLLNPKLYDVTKSGSKQDLLKLFTITDAQKKLLTRDPKYVNIFDEFLATLNKVKKEIKALELTIEEALEKEDKSNESLVNILAKGTTVSKKAKGEKAAKELNQEDVDKLLNIKDAADRETAILDALNAAPKDNAIAMIKDFGTAILKECPTAAMVRAIISIDPSTIKDKNFLESTTKDANLNVINALIKAGADVKNSDMLFAAQRNISEGKRANALADAKVTEALLDAGAPVDGISQDKNPLQAALGTGNVYTFKLLIQHGAKNTTPTTTLLGRAAEYGSTEIVKELLTNPEKYEKITSLDLFAKHKGDNNLLVELIETNGTSFKENTGSNLFQGQYTTVGNYLLNRAGLLEAGQETNPAAVAKAIGDFFEKCKEQKSKE